MPSLTAADMASRTMKKGWVNKTDDEEAADEAQTARERAAAVTGYGVRGLRIHNRTMHAAADEPKEADEARETAAAVTGKKRRRSPLYDKSTEDEE